MKYALCCGINNYPGTENDLSGCVNDANDWTQLLKSKFGFQSVSTLLDSEVTKENVLANLKVMFTLAKAGDTVVFSYSGHGTQVVDRNADEADGFDEALYLYNAVLTDDDLRSALDMVKSQVHVVIILDSCFSGTATRKVSVFGQDLKIKFVKNPETVGLPKKSTLAKVLAENDMVELLISGCSDNQYSYDAYINGRNSGAFTANAIPLMTEGRTYNEFYTELRKVLPSGPYPQTPQLEGSNASKNKKLFEYGQLTDVPEEPVPVVPEPTEENVTATAWGWWLAAAVIAIVGIVYFIFF